jgi:hypothetical protein
MGRVGRYSGEVQQRPLTTASQPGRQHTEHAGTMARHPALPLVRDEEALATMAKQQAISEAIQSVSAQIRGVSLVRSPSHCKTAPSDWATPAPG